MWQNWINFLAGVWVIISPYVGFTESALNTNLIISGAVIVILAVWGAMESNRRMSQMTRYWNKQNRPIRGGFVLQTYCELFNELYSVNL
jgi:hypothetical protein